MTHRLALLSLIFLLACPLPALGIEILQLTAGSITTAPFGSPVSVFDLQGPRLAISALGQTMQAEPYLAFRDCSGFGEGSGFGSCRPGDSIQIQNMSIVGGDWLGGTVALDGVAQPLDLGGGLADSVFLRINSSPLLIPDFGSIAAVTLLGSFHLTGTLRRRENCPPCDFPDFDKDFTSYQLNGQGTFTLDLVRKQFFEGPEWQWTSAELELQPVPEPATLLLWGTGAAGLGAVRWWKRRRSHDHAA